MQPNVILRRRAAGLNRDSLGDFVARASRAAGLRGAVTVLVTGDRQMRNLNWRFRGKDHSTDVLSFPPFAKTANFSGDLAVSLDTAARNARRLGHSLAEEVRILVLHGILHLAGYDHERDNGEMARKESDLRRQLRLGSGVIERAPHRGARRRTSAYR